MLKLLGLGILFVLSSGSLFSDQFRKNKLLLTGASLVVLVSGYYLFIAIWTDIVQIENKLQTVEEGSPMLPPLPEKKPNLKSDFSYKVEVRQGSARFVFPKEAIDQLFRIAPNGDLSGAMFEATIENHLHIVCQHFVAQGASSYNPLYHLKELLPKLDCDIWKKDPDSGDSFRFQTDDQYDIQKEYERLSSSLTIVVSGSTVINNFLRDSGSALVFRIGFPFYGELIQQNVKRS
jgi:hypothetical protein